MTKPRNETQLTGQIVKAVKQEYPEIWTLKTHGSGYQRVGVPDLIFCIRGQFVAVEVKHQKPGESVEHLLGRVSVRQRDELDAVHGAGGIAIVAWEIEHVLDALGEAVERAEYSH